MKQYPEVTKTNIYSFRQNNPELVVRDAREYLDLTEEECNILRTILLARGINKWLKVRRDLIAYKKQLKHTIKAIENQRKMVKGTPNYIVLREVSKALQSVRYTLRVLCKTDRWQIWPQLGSHHKELSAMNTIRASD